MKAKTRWDVCEQCVEVRDSGVYQERVLGFVARRRGREWLNPRHMVDQCAGMRWRKLIETCRSCPFAMEHTVLSQELQDE